MASCSTLAARSHGERSDIGDDPIVAVLTKRVSDAHLAGIRQEGVSYIFGGEQDLDLRLALEILCTGTGD